MPRLMAGERWRAVGDSEEDLDLGDSGKGKREPEPERRRLMRSLTAGSLWKRTKI